jgi:hypothetical protein
VKEKLTAQQRIYEHVYSGLLVAWLRPEHVKEATREDGSTHLQSKDFVYEVYAKAHRLALEAAHDVASCAACGSGDVDPSDHLNAPRCPKCLEGAQ